MIFPRDQGPWAPGTTPMIEAAGTSSAQLLLAGHALSPAVPLSSGCWCQSRKLVAGCFQLWEPGIQALHNLKKSVYNMKTQSSSLLIEHPVSSSAEWGVKAAEHKGTEECPKHAANSWHFLGLCSECQASPGWFAGINSFHPHRSPAAAVLLFCPFYG